MTISNFTEQNTESLSIWDGMQRDQCDFCLAQELPFFFQSTTWLAARTVLDVGSGNGHYLECLAECFPGKQYHGIDISGDLVRLAGSRCHRPDLDFVEKDLNAVSGQYDAVILRLLLQHLDSVENALDRVAEVTRPGSCVFIIDACDSFRTFVPDVPEFATFFQSYRDHQHAIGLDRDVKRRLTLALQERSDFTTSASVDVLIPSTVGDNLRLMQRNYAAFIRLVEIDGGLDYDFAAVKTAWENWASSKPIYTQVGLSIVELRRC